MSVITYIRDWLCALGFSTSKHHRMGFLHILKCTIVYSNSKFRIDLLFAGSIPEHRLHMFFIYMYICIYFTAAHVLLCPSMLHIFRQDVYHTNG